MSTTLYPPSPASEHIEKLTKGLRFLYVTITLTVLLLAWLLLSEPSTEPPKGQFDAAFAALEHSMLMPAFISVMLLHQIIVAFVARRRIATLRASHIRL